ncbi:MAG: tRNA (adenosine(37)-N6)-threonylcarbamoyltransferase complex ATPase subunit type 1 TsaE [Lentisphaeria bacterium]|nr:tRNA (adenosine(37)-N6)-threonylcarbamoyltransferase complex ATPase subunit type 1 TsaE [Lentisphaeria bacterium]
MRTTRIISDGEDATFQLGKRLAAVLPVGVTVSLRGDLGTGKTVFSRGFARGLGITEPVTSPTFAVVQEYACPDGRWLYHLDMYRITDEDAALAFGVDEFLFPKDAVSLVEWPERIEGLLIPGAGQRHVPVVIEHAGGDIRHITLPADLAK